MRSVSSTRASTLAMSVLPTPGCPSTRSGFFSIIARYTAVATPHQDRPMAITIEETFTVQAPAERVWRYLIDPRQVVECLPGAELVAVEDERTFLGKVRLKVGPVTAAYSGRAHFADVAEKERRVQIVAQGREAGGAGAGE